ncbi:hypothetical protein DXX94_08325 [Thalassotalea euphylliae]|uniref:Uncharacterized protein n=2 Tax=Thalassotalea euphylliae TaxID=1655234 RepID=A0A3E0U1Z0_9GAMM|nr:hypothetical protein DXX94_08325 [Thalassotalea euphylliae]
MQLIDEKSATLAKKVSGKFITPLLVAGILICLVNAIIACYLIYQESSVFQKTVRAEVKTQTIDAANQISEKLAGIMNDVNNFADRITRLEDKQDTLGFLRHEFYQNSNLFSLSTTFKPYAFDPTRKYVAPYYERLTDEEKEFELTGYDQNSTEFSWYNRPLKEGPIWTEPYYEPVNSVLMTTYSVPFYQSEKAREAGEAPLGVVPSDVSLDHLTTDLKQIQFGAGGYGIIFSSKQNLISHPVFSHVREGESLNTLKHKDGFNYLNKIDKCFADDLTYAFYNGEVMDNDEDYAACAHIPQTDWILITRMSADMFQMDKDYRRKSNIGAISWIAASLILIILLLTRYKQITWSQNNIWISIILVTGTVASLEFARSLNTLEEDSTVVITNTAQREAFISNYDAQLTQLRLDLPDYISTGLMVDSLEFVNANNIHLTGIVWERFETPRPEHIAPEIAFNEAIESDLKLAYRQTLPTGEEVVGWHFSVVIRQELDYSKYPFDHKNIVIRLTASNIGSNTVLVPDLEAYEKLGKTDNPAVAKDIVLEEWTLKQSYYKYTYQHFNTNFGINGHGFQEISPELNYSINIERSFLGPFVTTLLPVMVMVCLLYACVVSMPYTPYGELRNNITAVVFTILLAHYSIREHLQINEVVYFEVFYFLLYVIATVFMLIAHYYYRAKALDLNSKHFKRVAIVWYWPILTSAIYVITIWTYY